MKSKKATFFEESNDKLRRIFIDEDEVAVIFAFFESSSAYKKKWNLFKTMFLERKK